MADWPTIPTIDDLRQLPLRARIAFAARCARRAQPLFKLAWREAPDQHVRAVDEAIQQAEFFSSTRLIAIDASGAHTAAVAASVAARSVVGIATGRIAASAAYAAAYSAHAAYPAADASAAAYSAATEASAIGAGVDTMHRERMVEAIAADFRLLLTESKRLNWTNSTPVRPDRLGGLWPFGEPEWWPRDHRTVRQELLVELVVPEGISDEDLEALVVEHALAADALHAAAGGSGLKVDAIEVYKDVHVPQEVLQ